MAIAGLLGQRWTVRLATCWQNIISSLSRQDGYEIPTKAERVASGEEVGAEAEGEVAAKEEGDEEVQEEVQEGASAPGDRTFVDAWLADAEVPTLEATQGQIDGFFIQPPYECSPESGGICVRLTYDLPLGYLQGGSQTSSCASGLGVSGLNSAGLRV
jgi:hypothetical protein